MRELDLESSIALVTVLIMFWWLYRNFLSAFVNREVGVAHAEFGAPDGEVEIAVNPVKED